MTGLKKEELISCALFGLFVSVDEADLDVGKFLGDEPPGDGRGKASPAVDVSPGRGKKKAQAEGATPGSGRPPRKRGSAR